MNIKNAGAFQSGENTAGTFRPRDWRGRSLSMMFVATDDARSASAVAVRLVDVGQRIPGAKARAVIPGQLIAISSGGGCLHLISSRYSSIMYAAVSLSFS